MELKGKKILVTGITGQVAFPVASIIARDNEVWGAARFSDAAKRAAVEKQGIRAVSIDLGSGDFAALPTDFDYVLNLAVSKDPSESFDVDLRGNAEAAGLLMQHLRQAKAFLHCSTTGVYQAAGRQRLVETSDLGDNHRVSMKTYSISKIATEAVVRFAARAFKLPTIIMRLNVPYGMNGGWPGYHLEMIKHGVPIPLHEDKPNQFTLIHEEDIARSIPALLAAATVPARIVNWGSQETVSIEEWCTYIGELIGVQPQFTYTTQAIGSVLPNVDEMLRIAGPTRVSWRDGIRRMVEHRHPEWLVSKA